MNLKNRSILFSLLFFSISVFGQDTLSIYFDFGVSKIREDQFEILNSLQTKFDLSSVDSIHYIGMADSVGNFKANIKLSEKRAANAAKYCSKLFSKQLNENVKAIGELSNGKDNQLNRRVDIILFSELANAPDIDTMFHGKSIVNKELCYYVDYYLLHRSNIRNIKKRNKDLVIIETNDDVLKKCKGHYANSKYNGCLGHYIGSRNKKGEFVPKELKFTSKKSARLWWNDSKFIATVPKADYDRYKIFNIAFAPCDTCSQDFEHQNKILNEETCQQVDLFLMNNMQIKRILFRYHLVNIRAPREYVNLKDQYYIGCGYSDVLKWKTKKGRKKKYYYYSQLPRFSTHVANITRKMECCTATEPSYCYTPLFLCGGGAFGSPITSFNLIAEIGSHYQQDKVIPYAAIGTSKSGDKSQVAFYVGIHGDKSFYGSLRYQYHFLSFQFHELNLFSTWQKSVKGYTINQYCRFYVGTEFKTKLGKTIQNNYLEQNLHLGFAAVNTNYDAIIPKIFIQYGLGYDFLGHSTTILYPVLQAGLYFNITRFGNGIAPYIPNVRDL